MDLTASVYWQERTRLAPLPALAQPLGCDALVIGGGLAGLTAAALLRERGAEVVVLDAATCGSGATGRSSGFITPDSELQVAQLVRRFGADGARRVWLAGLEACAGIRRQAEAMPGQADLQEADSLYAAPTPKAGGAIRDEHGARLRAGLESRLETPATLAGLLGNGGGGFAQAVRYGGTFSIDPFAYLAGLRQRLLAAGVRIFENSPVVALSEHTARTAETEVTAASIFVCTDRCAPQLGIARRDVGHAQTFLMLSEPLEESCYRRAFPGAPLLVWDSDLLYHYFRPTPDRRILVGGSNLREVYGEAPQRPQQVLRQLTAYLRERLELPRSVRFSHWWAGSIGVTKDLLPLAGRSPEREHEWWALCGAGLPWSALAARTAVECALDGRSALADVFSPGRAFSEAEVLQPVLGKRATFALSHYLAKAGAAGPTATLPRRQRLLRAGLGAILLGALAVWTRSRRRTGRRGRRR